MPRRLSSPPSSCRDQFRAGPRLMYDVLFSYFLLGIGLSRGRKVHRAGNARSRSSVLRRDAQVHGCRARSRSPLARSVVLRLETVPSNRLSQQTDDARSRAGARAHSAGRPRRLGTDHLVVLAHGREATRRPPRQSLSLPCATLIKTAGELGAFQHDGSSAVPWPPVAGEAGHAGRGCRIPADTRSARSCADGRDRVAELAGMYSPHPWVRT